MASKSRRRARLARVLKARVGAPSRPQPAFCFTFLFWPIWRPRGPPPSARQKRHEPEARLHNTIALEPINRRTTRAHRASFARAPWPAERLNHCGPGAALKMETNLNLLQTHRLREQLGAPATSPRLNGASRPPHDGNGAPLREWARSKLPHFRFAIRQTAGSVQTLLAHARGGQLA